MPDIGFLDQIQDQRLMNYAQGQNLIQLYAKVGSGIQIES